MTFRGAECQKPSGRKFVWQKKIGRGIKNTGRFLVQIETIDAHVSQWRVSQFILNMDAARGQNVRKLSARTLRSARRKARTSARFCRWCFGFCCRVWRLRLREYAPHSANTREVSHITFQLQHFFSPQVCHWAVHCTPESGFRGFVSVQGPLFDCTLSDTPLGNLIKELWVDQSDCVGDWNWTERIPCKTFVLWSPALDSTFPFLVLAGITGELYYIRQGDVNMYALTFNMPLKPDINDIYFNWQNMKKPRDEGYREVRNTSKIHLAWFGRLNAPQVEREFLPLYQSNVFVATRPIFVPKGKHELTAVGDHQKERVMSAGRLSLRNSLHRCSTAWSQRCRNLRRWKNPPSTSPPKGGFRPRIPVSLPFLACSTQINGTPSSWSLLSSELCFARIFTCSIGSGAAQSVHDLVYEKHPGQIPRFQNSQSNQRKRSRW